MLWALPWMVLTRSHGPLNIHATFTSTEPIYIFTSQQWDFLGLFFIWALFTFFSDAFFMAANVIYIQKWMSLRAQRWKGDRRDEHITQYNVNREQCEWFQIKQHVTEGAMRLKKEYTYITTPPLCIHGMLQGELSQKVHTKFTGHMQKWPKWNCRHAETWITKPHITVLRKLRPKHCRMWYLLAVRRPGCVYIPTRKQASSKFLYYDRQQGCPSHENKMHYVWPIHF
jgi:hypothetical protein